MKFHKMHLILLILISSNAFAGMDAKFLDEMTMHHRQAVDMAKTADKKLSSSQVKKLNKKMMEDQKKEIARMDKWKKQVGSDKTADMGEGHAGMNMPMDMNMNMNMNMNMSEMKDLKGKDFDTKYLEMMSAHHSQAISMVQNYLSDLTNPEVKSFAEKTAKTQESEIEKMSKMKKDISSQ